MELLQKKYRLLLLLFCCSKFCLAQLPSVKTTVSNNGILIGEQFKLKIEAVFSGTEDQINWIAVPDTLQHFDLVEKTKLDSLYTNNQLTGLSQTFTLTSFDSGKWNLPVFKIAILPTNAVKAFNYFTDSLPITVTYSASDTSSQLRDIKPVYEVSAKFPIGYWIAAAALTLLIIALLIWLYRYWEKKKLNTGFKSKLSSFDEAMRQLNSLKKYNLTVAADTQQFHLKLVDIFKEFLSENNNTNHLNKTTGDLLIILKNKEIAADTISKMAASLRCADAVKFAKYLPAPVDSENCRLVITEMIEELHRKSPSKPATK